MYLRYFFTKANSYNCKVVGYQHRGSASHLVEDAFRVMEDIFRVLEDAYRLMEDVFRVLEDAYRLMEDVFRVLEDAYRVVEDVFRLNVSASHQLVSAVFVVVSAYRVRVFAFFISCFEKLGSQCAFTQVTRINIVVVGFNDKALGHFIVPTLQRHCH